jgi:DNA polymerase-3 subunit delta'
MHVPPRAEAIDWLTVRAVDEGLKAPTVEQALVWMQAAGERPDDALQWGRLGLTAQAWHALPLALSKGDWSALAEWTAAHQLALLQKLCHDLMCVAAGAPPRYFPADTLPPAPRWSVLARWSRALFQAARTVEHPFNPGLMQEVWGASTRLALSRVPQRP